MSSGPAPIETRAWHQALAYAVTGRAFVELGRQAAPDVRQLAGWLRSQTGFDADVATVRSAGPWPLPVPPALMTGLGWAQFSAALRSLVEQLDLAERAAPRPTTGSDRPTAADRRLLDEVPPHHVG